MVQLQAMEASDTRACVHEIDYREPFLTQQSAHFLNAEMTRLAESEESLTPEQRKTQLEVIAQASDWFGQGCKAMQQNDMVKALDCFKMGYMVHDQHIANLFNLAVFYDLAGKHVCSAEFFSKVLSLKPDFIPAYFGASLSNLKIGDYEEALALLERALLILEDQIAQERKEKGQQLLCDPVGNRSRSESKEALLVDCLYF